MAQYIELSQYNGTPITDTFDVFDGWMPVEEGLSIAVAAGNFEAQGISVDLKAARKVAAASGLLEITGTDVSLNLKQPKKLLINPAVLTVVGNDIDLRYWLLSADSKPLNAYYFQNIMR